MGTYLNIGDCLILAGKQCPKGFDIIFANESIAGFGQSQQTTGNIRTNSYANANASIYGNNAFAQGYGYSNTNYDDFSYGGASANYSRYIIYACN